MKISNKEIKALIIVGSILISIIYYQFGYVNFSEKLNQRRQAKVEVETRYNKVMSDIQTLDDRKSKSKILATKNVDKASGFYPEIIQPKLILEINKMMEECGIKGNITFSPIEVKEVEDTSPNTAKIPNTSFHTIIDGINDKVTGNSADNKGVSDSTAVTVPGITCQQLKTVISIPSTNNETFNEFLKKLEAYDRRIVCTTLNISGNSETDITADLSIEFFGVPKISDVDASYFEWDVSKVGTSNGLSFTNGVLNKNSEEKNDFVASLKPAASEFSTFRMGRSNDPTLESYIYVNENEAIDVVLELTEKDGKFYYKYSAGNSSIPINAGVEGAEFTPKSEEIVFKIFSEARIATDDKVAMKLKMINNTTKMVNIILDGDDTANPRVIVTPEGGQVNVK